MPSPDSKRRSYRLSPDRFVIGLLLLVCLLWLSDRFQWFGFNHHKGWAVLISVAAVGAAALAIVLWWAVSLIFGWRFQFGIRSLLVFCLASSIAVNWLTVEMRQAQRQAETVAWTNKHGGWWHYDWQVDKDGEEMSGPEPPAPRWALKAFGVDFFSSVVELEFDDTIITDAGMEQLKELPDLHRLHLNGTKVTDAGLGYLEGLTRLRQLWLCGTKITDAGLEHCTKLSQLFWLERLEYDDYGRWREATPTSFAQLPD